MNVYCVLQLQKCQQLSDTDLFSDNKGSPEELQKQLDLSTDFEFYMKVGGLVSPSISRTTYKCCFYYRK